MKGNQQRCPECGKFLKIVRSKEKVYIEGVGLDYYYYYVCKKHGTITSFNYLEESW